MPALPTIYDCIVLPAESEEESVQVRVDTESEKYQQILSILDVLKEYVKTQKDTALLMLRHCRLCGEGV